MNNQQPTKTILITGCSSGFGRELVREFLKQGWTVLATLRNMDSRKELFDGELKHFPNNLFLFDFDVNNQDQRQQLNQFIRDRFSGKLNVLINNAGQGFFGALTDFSDDQVRQQLEVNFFSAAFLCRDLLPFLIAAQGRIINISSLLGFTGMPFSSIYAASKFALEGLTEGLYYELQPKGVQVALVEPGGFRTNFATNTIWAAPSENSNFLFKEEAKRFTAMRTYLGTRPNPPSLLKVVTTVAELASLNKMPLRTQVGTDSKSAYLAKKLLPQGLFARIQATAMNRLMTKAERKLNGGNDAAKPSL
jgi:NAD(P)-dependent dehydrogenase (short-subunit alcohol dehydrogenase family)